MKITGNFRTAAALSLLMFATVFGSGCKSVHWSKANVNERVEESKKKGFPAGVPEEMVVIWRDAVYESTTSPSARGFGGRFYFYDKEMTPVRVEGELVIYGFDDSANDNPTKADRKFVFKAENLESHFSVTALGASYSFWIPWDQVGSERRSISLIPKFTTLDGKTVMGNQSVNVLPGKEPEGDTVVTVSSPKTESAVKAIASNWQKNGTVNQVAHFDEANTNIVMTGESRRTTTIHVPPETARRFQPGMTSGQPEMAPASAPTSNGLQPMQPAPEVNSAEADRASRDEARRSTHEKTSYFQPWPGMNEEDPKKTGGTGQ